MVQTAAQFRFCFFAVRDGLRRRLKEAKKTTQDIREFAEIEEAALVANEETEDREIEAIMRAPLTTLKVVATDNAEASRAEKAWGVDDYNLDHNITELESR